MLYYTSIYSGRARKIPLVSRSLVGVEGSAPSLLMVLMDELFESEEEGRSTSSGTENRCSADPCVLSFN